MSCGGLVPGPRGDSLAGLRDRHYTGRLLAILRLEPTVIASLHSSVSPGLRTPLVQTAVCHPTLTLPPSFSPPVYQRLHRLPTTPAGLDALFRADGRGRARIGASNALIYLLSMCSITGVHSRIATAFWRRSGRCGHFAAACRWCLRGELADHRPATEHFEGCLWPWRFAGSRSTLQSCLRCSERPTLVATTQRSVTLTMSNIYCLIIRLMASRGDTLRPSPLPRLCSLC